MVVTLKDILNTDIEENVPMEAVVPRVQGITERPDKHIELKALTRDMPEIQKTQKEPSTDLVVLETGTFEDIAELYRAAGESGYFIWCADTFEMWYASTQRCLDSNFIYRDDLEIVELGTDDTKLLEWYNSKVANHNYGIVTSKKCYILDNPACETYEVYYDSNYPSLHYGKATPKGCYIHSYPNRFYRDMAILELDALYSNTSNKEAGKLTTKPMVDDEAIIISDGTWTKGICACAYVYLDKVSVIKNVEGVIPSDKNQAIIIAELLGAYNALLLCYARGKKNITYYYDNTNILGLFRTKRLAGLVEVIRYKELLIKMDSEGYNINFVEIHPKTGENRSEENKALMYFHYQCDIACREMADISHKNYKAFATNGNKEGITYSQIIESQNKRDKSTNKWKNGNKNPKFRSSN